MDTTASKTQINRYILIDEAVLFAAKDTCLAIRHLDRVVARHQGEGRFDWVAEMLPRLDHYPWPEHIKERVLGTYTGISGTVPWADELQDAIYWAKVYRQEYPQADWSRLDDAFRDYARQTDHTQMTSGRVQQIARQVHAAEVQRQTPTGRKIERLSSCYSSLA